MSTSKSAPNLSLQDQWRLDLERQGKSELTVKAYLRAIRHLGRWYRKSYDQPLNPTQLVQRDIRGWKSYQQTVEKSSPATINQRLAGVSQFCRWMLRNELIAANPAEDVPTVERPSRRPKALNNRDLRKLLREVELSGNKRDAALIELLVGTGLRVSEALALTVDDLKLAYRGSVVRVAKGKRGKYREIPLTATVRKVLEEYLETLHPKPGPGQSLWQGQRGALKNPSAVYRMLNKYAFQAGLDGPIGPHLLRHTFATRYLEQNPDDLRTLAAILGHSSLDMVMIYTEPSVEDIAERMGRIVF